MGKFDVRNAELTIMDMLKYDAIKDDEGIIYKDMGEYVEMLVPMNNEKGHDTYEVHFDEKGYIWKVVGHPGNSGFSDTKYYT